MTAKQDALFRLILIVIAGIAICFMLFSCSPEQKICKTYGGTYNRRQVHKEIRHQSNYRLVKR